MDNLKEFQLMLNKAIEGEPLVFKDFDRANNVQDQLQEMVFTATDGTYNKVGTKVFAFADYWEEHGIPAMFTSLKQLWLAFVMRERFGKVWTGSDWLKET